MRFTSANRCRTASQLNIRIAAITGFAVVATALCGPASAVGETDAAAIASLQAAVAQLRQTTLALTATVSAQNRRIAKLEAQRVATGVSPSTTTQYGPFTVSGTNVYLTGYNLYIQSGSGSTDGKTNGLGNLIMGYDETRGTGDIRTGSHNIILGSKNNYASYGGIVGGNNNGIYGEYASVLGGQFNNAPGALSTVLGGQYCKTQGRLSSVSGGFRNTASGQYASVGGGDTVSAGAEYDFEPYNSGITGIRMAQAADANSITALQTTQNQQSAITNLFTLSNGVGTNTELTLTGVNLHIVNGLGATDGNPKDPGDNNDDAVVNGLGNLIIGYDDVLVAGPRTGSHNLILGTDNSYSGFGGIEAGVSNLMTGEWTSVFGGYKNLAFGPASSVLGGSNNTASGEWSTVTGGSNNMTSGTWSSVTGGYLNTASGGDSTVTGGYSNISGASWSSVSGGAYNAASGNSSVVSGGNSVTESSTSGWAGGSYHSP